MPTRLLLKGKKKASMKIGKSDVLRGVPAPPQSFKKLPTRFKPLQSTKHTNHDIFAIFPLSLSLFFAFLSFPYRTRQP